MMRAIMRGDGLRARILRSSGLTVVGYGTSQVLRLASNLVLTRILFPEAFGVMALVSVFMMGLNMFSDLGIGPSIQQNKRGDDPDFLNTAWTIQVIRGGILWAVATALAFPMAWFYNAPELAQLLPVASLTLLITAFNPTRLETANRHLLLGRVTVIDMATQVVGITSAVVLAWLLQSVWALVFSGIIGALAQLFLYNRFLPGMKNRFRWEGPAAHELIRFGKWIFLSTIAGFALSQGDRIVLGKFLPLEVLGVYNIGYFLASFPLLLGGVVIRRVLIPLYREKPPAQSRENFAKLQKMRFVMTGLVFSLVFVFAVSGVALVQVMYDARYAMAGAVVVVIAVAQLPQVIVLTYDQAALAAGDSKRFFVLAATRAALMIAGLLIGIQYFGLFGALVSQGIAMIAAYPVVVWLARKQGAWDPLHDLVFAGIGIGLGAVAVWFNYGAIGGAVAELSALKWP
ncbi:MAG: oligosaccharide flippase family protein [Rhodobacterales bacterium]|nr:oligosaccharide flippase family protein [Rhodobacterales bacterium]